MNYPARLDDWRNGDDPMDVTHLIPTNNNNLAVTNSAIKRRVENVFLLMNKKVISDLYSNRYHNVSTIMLSVELTHTLKRRHVFITIVY